MRYPLRMLRTILTAGLIALLGLSGCASTNPEPPGTVWIDGRGAVVREDGGGDVLDEWALHPTIGTTGFTAGGVLFWHPPELVILRHRDAGVTDQLVRRTDVPYRRASTGSSHRFVRVRGRGAEIARSEFAYPAMERVLVGEGANARWVEVRRRELQEIHAR